MIKIQKKSYQNFETNSYCVAAGHFSGAKIRERDKNPNGRKLLIGTCVKNNRKKSRTVSDKCRNFEGLGNLYSFIGTAAAQLVEKIC